jgi:hypothetical protein
MMGGILPRKIRMGRLTIRMPQVTTWAITKLTFFFNFRYTAFGVWSFCFEFLDVCLQCGVINWSDSPESLDSTGRNRKKQVLSLDLAGTSSDPVFLWRMQEAQCDLMRHKVISGERAPQKMVSGTTGVLTRACWSLESRQSLESSETTGISSRFS